MPNKDVQWKNIGRYLPKENVSKERDLRKYEVKKDLISVEKNNPPFSLQN